MFEVEFVWEIGLFLVELKAIQNFAESWSLYLTFATDFNVVVIVVIVLD